MKYTTQIRIKRLTPTAIIPRYQTDGAAGMDLHADDEVTLWPGDRRAVKTGIAVAIPPGHEGQVRPRSGLAARFGVTVLNSPGTIDSDYRGEVCVILVNHGQQEWRFERGERVAQLVIAPVARAEMVDVDDLDETTRGSGGLGSTGT
jgi:dUTP pyrophosphatase